MNDDNLTQAQWEAEMRRLNHDWCKAWNDDLQVDAPTPRSSEDTQEA